MNDSYSRIDIISKSLEDLRSKYVPDMGAAGTVGGEIIRALDRVLYRYFNDGDRVDEGYGIETVNSSYRFLRDEIKGCPEVGTYGSKPYEQQLEDLAAWVSSYLDENPELFHEKNYGDSREMSDEERCMAREWEQGEYDDEDWDDDEEEDDY